MIKTLRITSIIAVILAAGFLVFPIIFGFRSDEAIERFLNSAGVIEKFRQASGDREGRSEGQISPLVKQADAFAAYLIGPAKPERPKPREDTTVPDVPPPAPIYRPKFTLIGTTVNELRPEESLALIDEPGKGRNWVRQSSVVGHLTIEQVKDGLVIVRGSKGPFELPVVARPPRRSLLEGSSPEPIGSKLTPVSGLSGAGSAVSPATGPAMGSMADILTSTLQQMGDKEAALAEELFRELGTMFKGAESDKTDSEPVDKENAPSAGKVVPGPEGRRISDEEAKRLGHLGQELKDVGQDPNQAKVRRDPRLRKDWKERRNRILKERAKARAQALAEQSSQAEK